MQLVGSKRPKSLDDLGGAIKLLPVEPEDMWHANNLIAPTDIIKAHTWRKVPPPEGKKGGSTRHHLDLVIRVTKTFFDAAGSELHVSGTVVEENPFTDVGQHHTIHLELSRPFVLMKEFGWDSVALKELTTALKTDKDGAVAAIVMHEGIANICLITEYRTILKQRIESSIPKKRAGSSEQDKGMRSFYRKMLDGLLKQIDFEVPRPLLLASPGFVAIEFKNYIGEEGGRLADKKLLGIAKEATVVHSSSGYIHSLNEVLKSPEVLAKMKDMKFSKETRYMDDFFKGLRDDNGRAWYGVQPVEKAVREGAVGAGGGILFINHSLFRSLDIDTRRRYVALVDSVKDFGGDVRILSADHESGQRLDALGGIAALLTYPCYDLDEDEDATESSGGSDEGEMII